MPQKSSSFLYLWKKGCFVKVIIQAASGGKVSKKLCKNIFRRNELESTNIPVNPVIDLKKKKKSVISFPQNVVYQKGKLHQEKREVLSLGSQTKFFIISV